MLTKRVDRDGTVRLSIHRQFMMAEPRVWEAIEYWAEGKERPEDRKLLREYINREISSSPKPVALETKGRVHDLRELFDEANHTYFEGELDQPITWASWRSRTKMGLYRPEDGLIQINRRLDSIRYPREYVGFIVYHEMLHHVIPPLYDKAGRCRYHNAAFRKREKLYHHYELVSKWEKNDGRT